MKKRVLSALLAALLLAVTAPLPASAAGGLGNFTRVNTYVSGQFTDVPPDAWYAPNVQLAYEYGLINGKSATAYEPGSNLTIAEAIKLAVCLNSIYQTGSAAFPGGDTWYRPYVDYALQNGIISAAYPNYDAPATRAECAVIFAAALPAEALAPINTVEDGAIPDVPPGYSYAPAVYLLYRAGVLTGSDLYGTFFPGNNIQRTEIAAIVTRMANAGFRKALTLGAPLTAGEVSDKCSPAVFHIDTYDADGNAIASGGGFFLTSAGLAVTSCRVIKDAMSAGVVTSDGRVYRVLGVYDYSMDNDLALLQVNGSGFPYLSVGDSSAVKAGWTVYAIDSPAAMTNTFSEGLVYSTSQAVGGAPCIQTTAPASPGSGGGALIDAYGNAVGVTSAAPDGGQGMNLAIPINLASPLSTAELTPLSAISWNAWLSLSPSSVTLNAGAVTAVTATDIQNVCKNIAYSVADKSIVSCAFNYYWDGNTIALSVKGLQAGTTTVTVYLLDDQNNRISSADLAVSVT